MIKVDTGGRSSDLYMLDVKKRCIFFFSMVEFIEFQMIMVKISFRMVGDQFTNVLLSN